MQAEKQTRELIDVGYVIGINPELTMTILHCSPNIKYTRICDLA